MIDPRITNDPIGKFLMHAANNIELNIQLKENVDWSDPNYRSGIIGLIIGMWEIYKSKEEKD